LTNDLARELLGLSVRVDGVRLGTVGAVWVDTRNEVLGMEVRSAWSNDVHYLPYATAGVRDGAVHASSLTVLATGPTTFFAEQGARRVAVATESVGLATARPG
jgi:hypothetical protein